MKFSPKKIGFYNPSLENKYKEQGSWPDDLIDLTNDEIKMFVNSPVPDGMALSVTEEGRPSFIDVAPITKEERTIIELSWRDGELVKVLNRIDQYEKDQNYPEELRTSPIQSNDDFLSLLSDRKLLSDYPDNEAFPFGERPVLSGLVK